MEKYYGVHMGQIVDHLFQHELNELGEYIETIEGALNKKFKEFGDSISRTMASMSEYQKSEYMEWVSDDAFRLADQFPSMVRKTSFVFLYGLFEHTLLNLCRHVKKYGKFKEKVTGGSDKGITAAKVFLKTVAKVKFPDQSREWNDITMMAEIRNLLAHRQGRVKGDPSKALLAYMKKQKGLIELTGANEIKFNEGYCQNAIEVIRTFFAALLKQIPDDLLQQTVEDDIAETVESMKELRSKKK